MEQLGATIIVVVTLFTCMVILGIGIGVMLRNRPHKRAQRTFAPIKAEIDQHWDNKRKEMEGRSKLEDSSVMNLDKEGLTLLEEIQAVETLMALTSLKGLNTIYLIHHGMIYALTLDQAKNMLDQVRIDQGMQLLIDNLKGGK